MSSSFTMVERSLPPISSPKSPSSSHNKMSAASAYLLHLQEKKSPPSSSSSKKMVLLAPSKKDVPKVTGAGAEKRSASFSSPSLSPTTATTATTPNTVSQRLERMANSSKSPLPPPPPLSEDPHHSTSAAAVLYTMDSPPQGSANNNNNNALLNRKSVNSSTTTATYMSSSSSNSSCATLASMGGGTTGELSSSPTPDLELPEPPLAPVTSPRAAVENTWPQSQYTRRHARLRGGPTPPPPPQARPSWGSNSTSSSRQGGWSGGKTPKFGSARKKPLETIDNQDVPVFPKQVAPPAHHHHLLDDLPHHSYQHPSPHYSAGSARSSPSVSMLLDSSHSVDATNSLQAPSFYNPDPAKLPDDDDDHEDDMPDFSPEASVQNQTVNSFNTTPTTSSPPPQHHHQQEHHELVEYTDRDENDVLAMINQLISETSERWRRNVTEIADNTHTSLARRSQNVIQEQQREIETLRAQLQAALQKQQSQDNNDDEDDDEELRTTTALRQAASKHAFALEQIDTIPVEHIELCHSGGEFHMDDVTVLSVPTVLAAEDWAVTRGGQRPDSESVLTGIGGTDDDLPLTSYSAFSSSSSPAKPLPPPASRPPNLPRAGGASSTPPLHPSTAAASSAALLSSHHHHHPPLPPQVVGSQHNKSSNSNKPPETIVRTRVHNMTVQLKAANGRICQASYSGPVDGTTGVPHGVGVLKFLETGDLYMGDVVQGQMHGHGTFTFAGKKKKKKPLQVLKGRFEHNVYCGI